MSDVSYAALRKLLNEMSTDPENPGPVRSKKLISRISRISAGSVSRAAHGKGKYEPSVEAKRRLFRACMGVDLINEKVQEMVEELREPEPMPRGPGTGPKVHMRKKRAPR